MSEDVILDVRSAAEAMRAFDREVDAERRASMSAWALAGEPEGEARWLVMFEERVKAGRRSLAQFVTEAWPEEAARVRAWLASHEREP